MPHDQSSADAPTLAPPDEPPATDLDPDLEADLDAALGPEPGWEELHHPPARRDPSRTRPGRFVPTEPNSTLALRCYRRASDGAIVGKAWFGPDSMGPPGYAHGGAQMAVLDHAFGAAAWSSGFPVVTASMTYDFRRGLPIGTVARVEAVVESVEGRKVRTRGRLTDERGQVYGEGHALFLTMSGHRARADAEETAG